MRDDYFVLMPACVSTRGESRRDVLAQGIERRSEAHIDRGSRARLVTPVLLSRPVAQLALLLRESKVPRARGPRRSIRNSSSSNVGLLYAILRTHTHFCTHRVRSLDKRGESALMYGFTWRLNFNSLKAITAPSVVVVFV